MAIASSLSWKFSYKTARVLQQDSLFIDPQECSASRYSFHKLPLSLSERKKCIKTKFVTEDPSSSLTSKETTRQKALTGYFLLHPRKFLFAAAWKAIPWLFSTTNGSTSWKAGFVKRSYFLLHIPIVHLKRKSEFLFRVKFIGVTLEICMNSHVLREASEPCRGSKRSQMVSPNEESSRLREFSSEVARITSLSHVAVISTCGRGFACCSNFIVDWYCANKIILPKCAPHFSLSFFWDHPRHIKANAINHFSHEILLQWNWCKANIVNIFMRMDLCDNQIWLRMRLNVIELKIFDAIWVLRGF